MEIGQVSIFEHRQTPGARGIKLCVDSDLNLCVHTLILFLEIKLAQVSGVEKATATITLAQWVLLNMVNY